AAFTTVHNPMRAGAGAASRARQPRPAMLPHLPARARVTACTSCQTPRGSGAERSGPDELSGASLIACFPPADPQGPQLRVLAPSPVGRSTLRRRRALVRRGRRAVLPQRRGGGVLLRLGRRLLPP